MSMLLLISIIGASGLVAGSIAAYNYWQRTQVDRMVARVEAEAAAAQAQKVTSPR